MALAVACGGSIDVTDGGTPDGGDNADGAGPDAWPGPDCPTQLPSGGACSEEGIECEYGGDPRWTCNTIARCSGGHWTALNESAPSCPTSPVNPPPCPSTYKEAEQGGACSSNAAVCDYSTSSATQADTSMSRQHLGLGLGLAIVRRLAEAHGGRVRAESAGLGRGATFVVELPLLAPEADVDDSAHAA